MKTYQKSLQSITFLVAVAILGILQCAAQPSIFDSKPGGYNYSISVVKSDGLVFTINSTDKQTGESLGSMEVLVQGVFLKVTSFESRSQGMKVDTGLDQALEMSAIDEAASDLDDSNAHNNASGSNGASVITNTNISNNPVSGEMIYRADRREMIVVDHENKEYFVADEAFLGTIKENFGDVAEQMNEVTGMMQQAYETALAQLDAQGLSPKERAAAEQMLRNTFGIANTPTAPGSTNLEIENLGRVPFNGYPAVKYELLLGGEKMRELWVADWKDLGVGAPEQETFESYFNFFAEMSNAYDEMSFGTDGDYIFFETMDQIGGFPVFGQYFEDGEVDEEFSLESLTKRTFDPDAFDPPGGYKRL